MPAGHLLILDRQAEFTINQPLPPLVDADLLSANITELILALDRDRPFHCHRRLLHRGDQDGPAGTNSSCAPQKSYRSPLAYLGLGSRRSIGVPAVAEPDGPVGRDR